MGARQKHLRFCLLLCGWQMTVAHSACINLKVLPVLNKVRICIQCYKYISTTGKNFCLNIALFYQNGWIKLYNTWVSCPLTSKNKANSFASWTACYHSPIDKGWEKLQGIGLFNISFHNLTVSTDAFPFQTLPSPAGWTAGCQVRVSPTRSLFASTLYQHAIATLFLHFNLASSLS